METLVSADPRLVAEFLAGDSAGEERNKLSSEEAEAESRAIELFLSESENLVALSDDVIKCDDILKTLEEVLGNFDSTLDAASDEILAYQQRSSALLDELNSKREIKDQIHLFVDSLVLTQRLIRDISGAPVSGEVFAAALVELKRKLDFVYGSARVQDSAAYKDVAIEMERLRLMAVKRERDFVLGKIREVRQTRSNMQAQQNLLIRHRHMVGFLREHGNNTYAELRAEYCSSVSSKFLDVFKGYWSCLEGMAKSEAAVLLGARTQSSSYYSYFESLFDARDDGEDAQEGFFELGDRLVDSSRRIHESPLVPSDSRRGKETFETIFSSISRLLVDTAAHEYLFCMNFWQSEGPRVFQDVFTPIFEFVQGSLAASLQDQNDVIALLLCININQQNFLLMTKRRNPALDGHFDAVNLLLWPRVKLMLDRHLKSVVDLGGMEEESRQTSAHRKDKLMPLTRRYAAMMASVLVIMEFITDGSISLNIEQLRYAVLNHLLAASRRFQRPGEGTVFLLHNLHHIVTVLKAAGHRQEAIDQAFSRAIDLFGDTHLKPLLENPKEMSSRAVQELRQNIRAEFRKTGAPADALDALGEIVEKTAMATLCERWNAYLAVSEDSISSLSMADLFKACCW